MTESVLCPIATPHLSAPTPTRDLYLADASDFSPGVAWMELLLAGDKF
ncbi:MAG: hypothetical protein H0M93_01605 [Methanophagales archaeon]|nr:hypothetical protein [Methanophagales archaeon]